MVRSVDVTNQPVDRVRAACAVALAVAVLPYAGLKVLWLSGSTLGLPAASPARHGFAGANAATLALDAVALGLALVLVHPRGRRVPAWLVLLPAWLGTGLLLPTVVEVPAGFLAGLLTAGRPVAMPDGLVTDRTYVLVYASFALQGALLAVCFARYAAARWPAVLATRRPALSGPLRDVLRVPAAGAAMLATGAGLARLYQAFAAPAGWRHGPWTFSTRLVQLVDGSAALAAAAGVLLVTGYGAGRLGARTGRVAVVLGWLGSGALVGWGLMNVLSLVVRAPLAGTITPVAGALRLADLLAGLVVAFVTLVAVAGSGPASRA